MKPIVLRIHFHKAGAPKLPWTLHCSKGCFPASHVKFIGKFETEEKPTKATNPRYFIKCVGTFVYDGDTLIVSAKNK